VRDKTASLFSFAARSGARLAGAPAAAVDALGAYGEHLGVAFQLVDDALDYAGEKAVTGKSLYADLHEGKVTLPLVRALAARPSPAGDAERARDGDALAASRLAAAVLDSRACDDVRALAKDETNRALAALASRVPPCPARDLLACVASELAAR